jgi:glutaminyl-peptide cyclotransferase
MMRTRISLLGLWLLIGAPASAAVPTYDYEITHVYPHDTSAFTEGLFYLNGFLYESTGLEQHSSIRKVRIKTGEVVQKVDIPAQYFGEGIVNWQGHLISLTWKSQIGFVFDLATFKLQRQFSYPGEGWALTRNDKQLIMSDGTPYLRFLDPKTLAETGRIQVTLEGKPLRNVNELEWVKGEIYANVWQTNYIVRIDPGSGRVVGLINLAGLLQPSDIVCLRRPGRPPVRHRQELAEIIRDSAAQSPRNGARRSLRRDSSQTGARRPVVPVRSAGCRLGAPRTP